MSQFNTAPKASSTTVKSNISRSIGNQFQNTNCNDTFSSMFSEELTKGDLVKKTFTESLKNKNNILTETMNSSLSGQSSLGILELDNISDFGNTFKRGAFSSNSTNNQHDVLQRRLSQAAQARDTLSRANQTTQLKFPLEQEVDATSVRTSLLNITNAFKNMLKEDGISSSNCSFNSDDFIPGSEFKENLAEIEEVNRKEFGSLSESRFNFSLEGEKQSNENGSFAAKYFAAKSVPVEDLSSIFPSRQNKKNVSFRNLTFTKEDNCSLLSHTNIKKKQEDEALIGYKTMSSITSWTDSHVSNNMLNLTSLSDISEVLTSKTNSADPKDLTKALLSGDVSSDNKQLNETNNFLQRRLSTSTRFSIASQNLKFGERSFPSLDNFSFVSRQKNDRDINAINLEQNNICDFKLNDKNEKDEQFLNALSQCLSKDETRFFTNCDKNQSEIPVNNKSYFILTPKSGYFEDCTSGTEMSENSINLSNFTIMTNNHDILTEMTLNKSINVSKSVYCNESLCQDEIKRPQSQDYRTKSQILEIGDICIGTYCQAVITLENCLTIDAKFTLNLLNISHNCTKHMFVEKTPIGKSIATVICSDKLCIIPAMSEVSYTVGVIPLISGVINIHIKLESNDVSQEIYRNIQINSMEPQITWVNNSFGSIDFGLLPELSQKSFPIKLLNKGSYQVPVKFILNQDHREDVVHAKAIINPSELWQCDVNILTPSFTENDRKTKSFTSRLRIVLDSVEELSPSYSPLLYYSNLSGRVGFTSISMNPNPLILQRNGLSIFNGAVEVCNNSELPINLFVQQKSKQCSELTVQPQKFQLSINEKIKIKIVYHPSKSSNYFNEKNICLQVASSQKQFFLKINCVEPNIEYQQISLPSPRPVSPWSSTSSSSAVGHLDLESTCSSLIWGSVPSNTKSVQTFTLRNRGSHKEKLVLIIKDNKNCFKMISSGENQVSEMKLLLAPMESQKLSVALISTSNEGQAYGQLCLHRQHSSEKRVISLFGYCGHSVITINGTFEDNMGNMWLYPNAQLMTGQFSVTNNGNTTAFVKICQENSSEDIIEPTEFLLKKGETTTVEVTIIMSPERLEMLIQQDCYSKVINVNKISLIYGDEVSRVRISRLWNKIRNEKRIVYPDPQRLDEISKMFNRKQFANVDHFADTEKSLVKLWQSDISEDSIVVLMEKSNLESLLCDATTVFSELDTTIISRLS